LGLILKTSEGYWKPTDKILTTGDNVKDECFQRYQLSFHSILKQVLEENIPGSHDSSQLTVSVSKKGLERIVSRLRNLRSEIISISHKDETSADRVYQIALHAYPISRKD
jgi:uncharacterized protein (TIGR02147 family)